MTTTAAIITVSLVIATIAAVGLAVILAVARAHCRSQVARGICAAGMVLTIALAPGLVDLLVRELNASAGVGRIFIHPGPLTLWLPSFGALIALLVATRRMSLHAPAN